MTPMTAKITKYLEIDIDDKDAIKPVTVVPTYAPKIILSDYSFDNAETTLYKTLNLSGFSLIFLLLISCLIVS